MSAVPFASLTPTQQAQAAATFQDALFGKDPAAYTYELQADGQLTGQRSLVVMSDAKKLHGKRSPLNIFTSGQLVLSDQNAQVFARLILPGLLKSQSEPLPEDVEIMHMDLASLPTAMGSALSVVAPSLPNPGWEQGGWCE